MQRRGLHLVAVLALLLGGCDQPAVTSAIPTALPACLRPAAIPSRSFILFFGQHTTAFSDRGQRILDELANLARDNVEFILILGGVDGSETGPADRDLARRRSEAVRTYLEALPRPKYRIAVAADPLPLLVPTPPGKAEPQNRRVQIWPMGLGINDRLRDRAECAAWMRDHCLSVDATEGGQCTKALDWLGR